jgi:hypothetical protein
VTINNFSNFGIDRKVTYYRPEAELEPAERLAGRIEVKAVLGHDLGSNKRPEPRRFTGRNSQGLSYPGSAPNTGFRLRPATIWPGLCYNAMEKIV